MDAFYFVDKPTGQTSFQVLRDMRRILGIKKIGHTGTLDPLATGGLLVATGNYTKLITCFEKDSKSYRAMMMLDGTSPSFDSDTDISYISEKQQKYFSELFSQDKIEKILRQNFLGKIQQIPPKYSALKIDGKRALDRVKAGENIQMKAREAEVFSYKIISFSYPQLIVEISVSAGTYIRSIAHDLGEILGTGAYLSALRRIAVGILGESKMISLDQLTPEKALHPKEIFPGNIFPLDDSKVFHRLQDGQRVRGEFPYPENKDILLEYQGQLRYIGEYKNGVLHPKKCIIPKI